MKKLTLSIVIAVSALYNTAQAQVGINTNAPATTLDITAKNTTGSTSNVDGVLIPRVDRQRAQSMTAVPTSTLLYVNSVATGTQTGTAANIDSMGYYYFDGILWVKLYNPNNAPYALGNIYTVDGALTGNRIVTQGANTLAFTGSAVNVFSVAGSTFSVDAANSRVGIGTATPAGQLDLGQTTANRKLVLYGSFNNDNQFYGLGVNPGILRYQADVTATDHVFYAGTSATASTELMRIKGTGNVGVGTSAPENRFHVTSTTPVANRFTLFEAPASTNGFVITSLRNTSPLAVGNLALIGFTNNGPTSGGAAWGIGSIRTGITGSSAEEDFFFGNSLGGTYLERMRIKSTGLVGIGTSVPSNLLHINGTDPLRLQGLQPSVASSGTLAVNATGVVQLRNSASISAVRATGNVTITQNNAFANAISTAESFDNLNEFSGNTFTASVAGMYKVDFQINYPQRPATEDTGDGYLAYAQVSLNGTSYTFTNTKVVIPEASGAPSFVTATNSTLVKMNTGDVLTFQGLSFGSTPTIAAPITAPFSVGIVRVD